LCGQFRNALPILRQHLLERRPRVVRLDAPEGGQRF
jgi:hypothetical protein